MLVVFVDCARHHYVDTTPPPPSLSSSEPQARKWCGSGSGTLKRSLAIATRDGGLGRLLATAARDGGSWG